MDRRCFLKHAGAIALSGMMVDHVGRAATSPTLFYVDGYHGGARGHMPPGCWRDILEAMRAHPEWKLSLDVEPGSWDALAREDPQAYHEVQAYLADTTLNARIELVGGTFAQPYGWAISGESNIRQLQRGLTILKRHFPAASVRVYAVQEPCWASCLPQILVSLGFKGASLKNASTAWGGYSAGFNAELANWIGPDGTGIVTVPRYACELLEKTWETEAVDGSLAYAMECVDNNIPQPVGMCFQDLGWAAKPRVAGSYIEYVTWQEYLFQIADVPPKNWHFTMEDILTTLPWGEKTLQKVAQQPRSAECRLLMAEKLAAMAWVHGRTPWPANQLTAAWEQVMWSQFHDSWITATTRYGRDAWAFQVASETLDAQNAADDIIHQSVQALSSGQGDPVLHPLGAQWLRVVNTVAAERHELVESIVALDRHTEALRVLDQHGVNVPCQWSAIREYKDAGANSVSSVDSKLPVELNTVRLLFKASVPSLGFNTYQVVPLPRMENESSEPAVRAVSREDGTMLVENEFYVLHFDPKRGGAITSLVMKDGSLEICPKTSDFLFNEYRGYFITQKKWRSSTESIAKIDLVESGPLRVVVRIDAEVGGCPCSTLVTVASGQRRIGFDVTFHFDQETWIGDPWDILPKDRSTEQRRSSNDGRWKLQAMFPTAFSNKALYKNGAYDVCKSRNENTYFQRWDEIKHNIILNWVDVADETRNLGLALFSEHTTAYTHGPDHPLSLVLGWGWEGGFWWGKCPLLGEQRSRYSLIPHRGDWNDAKLWQEQARIEEPLMSQLIDGVHFAGSSNDFFVSLSDDAVLVPTMQVVGDSVEIRLFNAQSTNSACTVTLGFKSPRAELIELDGRVIETLAVTESTNGASSISLTLPGFAIRTLRFSMA